MSLGESGYERKTKRTRKREFLDEMNLVVPWAELVSLIAPHAPAPGAKGGRPPFAVETMLRIHFLHQWFNLSDPFNGVWMECGRHRKMHTGQYYNQVNLLIEETNPRTKANVEFTLLRIRAMLRAGVL